MKVRILGLLAIIYHTRSMRVLMIGDSVDRMTVLDWCSVLHGQDEMYATLIPYAADKLRASGKGVQHGGFSCLDHKNNNSLASFSIFGSNRTGPYWMDDISYDRIDIVQDSYDRLNLGLGEYFSKFPPPHRIFIHTAQWDNAHLIRVYGYTQLNQRGSELWNQTIASFEEALNDRIDQVLKLVSNYNTECGPVQVGLRSAIFSPHFEPAGSPSKWYVGQAREHRLLFEMNDIIRRLAKKRNLLLYDGDTDFWTTYEYKYKDQANLFRDYIHPHAIYTATFGEKMMSLQYSSYLTGTKNRTCLEFPQLWLHSSNYSQPRPKFINKVYLIHTHPEERGNQPVSIDLNQERHHHRYNVTPETTFFIQYESTTNLMESIHFHGDDLHFQKRLRLGFGDMLFVTQEELSGVKQGLWIPSFLRGEHLEEKKLFNFSTLSLAADSGLTSTGLYIVHKGYFRKITFPVTNETRLFPLWDTDEDVGLLKGMQVDSLPRKGDIADIYHLSLLVRQKESKEFFFIAINGTKGVKRSVNSMTVAENHHMDLNRAVVVTEDDDMKVIPTGEPLMS